MQTLNMLNAFAQKYKDILQSISIFPSWLLMIYSGIFFLPAIFLIVFKESILSTSILITFIGLFALGFVTVRGEKWNYIGWCALTIALGYLVLAIPDGLQLGYLAILTGIICLSSYLGFAYRKVEVSRISVVVAGVFFLSVFVSHTVVLANPETFGLEVEGNEFPTFTNRIIQKMVDMDPVEFVKTEEGRKIAIDTYDTSLFVPQEELQNLVRANPAPIEEVQQSLLFTDPFANNPYGYIMSIYTHSFINYLTK